MSKKKNKEDLARTRHISIRLNNKEDCLIWDNFVSDLKVNNVGKKHSERKIINQILSDLIMDFVRNKKVNNYKVEIATVIQPYIDKAIKSSMRLALVSLVKNQNDLIKQNYQLASVITLIARIVSRIQKPDGTDLVQSDKVESGETKSKELFSWLDAFKLEGEKV